MYYHCNQVQERVDDRYRENSALIRIVNDTDESQTIHIVSGVRSPDNTLIQPLVQRTILDPEGSSVFPFYPEHFRVVSVLNKENKRFESCVVERAATYPVSYLEACIEVQRRMREQGIRY